MPSARLRTDQVADAIKDSVGNTKSKRTPDGNSLYLITRNGRGYWTYQGREGSAPRTKLLGSAADVSANQARRAREEFVVERRKGNAGQRRGIANRMAHPAPEKRAGGAAKLFGELVAEYLADKAPGWIGGLEGKQAVDYRSSLIGHNFTKMLDIKVIKVGLESAAPRPSVACFAKLPVFPIGT